MGEVSESPVHKKSLLKRWLIIAGGWVFIILGIAGTFLPLLPGILFLAFGISLLASEYHWARRVIHVFRQRFPWLDKHLERLHQKFGHD